MLALTNDFHVKGFQDQRLKDTLTLKDRDHRRHSGILTMTLKLAIKQVSGFCCPSQAHYHSQHPAQLTGAPRRCPESEMPRTTLSSPPTPPATAAIFA
mmetsp:Transcript_42527/g.76326  ORF Transcript_42527/g.76326 Transcript_42527/m.76326 type:complete len:98 (-) Transcript_42527:987-1280(-)